MLLNYKEEGQGVSVVILHGLFGMLDNWATISKSLSSTCHVVTVDLRNHGRSFHDPELNYPVMAKDVSELIEFLKLDHVHIIGHSMGGKVAMQLAELNPNKIQSISILDIAPVEYERGHDDIFDTIFNLDLRSLSTRGQIQEKMLQSLHSISVVQFLMKSLERTSDGFRWRTNFDALYEHYDTLRLSPDLTTIKKPAMFVTGTKSPYVDQEGLRAIAQYFENFRVEEIEAGHWIHAEKPEELLDIIKTFIGQNSVKKL